MNEENKKYFKKYLIYSFAFLIAAICAGVFYREFSKFYGVVNTYTPLGLAHPHLLTLGMLMMLVFGFVNIKLGVQDNKLIKIFTPIYVVATSGASIMLIARGIIDVLIKSGTIEGISSGVDGMISGISGLFHIVLGAMIIAIFVIRILSLKSKKEAK